MVVILFHNNDDILLQKYQKEFILKNQSTENILYAQHPIRCTLSKDTLSKLELKELGKTITKITLEKVEWDNESQTLNCNATLHHHDKKQCKLTFPLVHCLKTQKKIAENTLIFPATSIFPKTLKTFRIGNETIIDSTSSIVSDYIWH